MRIGGVSSLDIDRTMMPFAVPARDMSCADRAGLGRLMPRLRLSPPTFAHGARRCGAGGRERERADCSANTFRLEVIYTALERYDQGRHNAYKKVGGPMIITAALG